MFRATIRYLANLRVNLRLTIFNILIWLPCGRHYLEKEAKKMKEDFYRKTKASRKNQVFNLPEKAWKEETIMARIKQGSDESKKYYINGGKLSGAVYTAQEEHWDFISDVMRQSIVSNPLHIMEFSNITQMEAEIIRMTLNLFHGPQDSCGLVTSGGTESIMVAMLAYREWGRKKGIHSPNIVVSSTAHSAFEKACFYLGMEIRKVFIGKDFACDVKGMRSRIDSNTVCVVASAPEYAFGNYDPIPQIAAMA